MVVYFHFCPKSSRTDLEESFALSFLLSLYFNEVKTEVIYVGMDSYTDIN